MEEIKKEIEKVENYYLDETQLKRQPYTVYRIKVGNGRLYYTLDPNLDPTFYISLTTLTRGTLPTSEHLIKWIAQMGYDKAREYMNERAKYGTIMHLAFGYFLIFGEWNFDTTEEWIKGQVETGAAEYLENIADDLNRDVAAFAQFVVDHKVKPMAIELVLVSKDGYGTLCDLVCKMTIEEKGFNGEVYKSGDNKGKPKETKVEREINALLNFKSGRKGFYEEMEIQLEFEKRLFEENYPEVKIDRIYNFSPKDWISTPSYNLKDQSDSMAKEKADALLCIAKIELMKRTGKEKKLTGKIKMGEAAEIIEKNIYDIVKERHGVVELTSADEELIKAAFGA